MNHGKFEGCRVSPTQNLHEKSFPPVGNQFSPFDLIQAEQMNRRVCNSHILQVRSFRADKFPSPVPCNPASSKQTSWFHYSSNSPARETTIFSQSSWRAS